jgi:hypothetical protein
MADSLPLWHDGRWLVTTAIALWGAGLSTYREWTTRSQRIADVGVSFSTEGFAPASSLGLDDSTEQHQVVSVSVTNRGHVDTTFNPQCCRFEFAGFDGGAVLVPNLSEPRLPTTLKHGQGLRLVQAAYEFKLQAYGVTDAAGQFSARCCVTDAIGRSFFSPWSFVNIDLF